ncbi:MAG: 30S ribosomal protein S7 [Candidatus Portnoybacteria bacterium CG10_big_fil_rev_8_21_14_0_10_36_7]|uniref:Small ribosomal subunit protein uS7 n=1 Tax=Candidatus Portnoybacteria bacterium CG10_big_fil_rev_8_21_14_0_10_36_7 TaxID=1974812 RepID=A0A2M8KDX0_9BACT|nr:MAG: 30S ribosomal protein S7 [Candidatus Portnoybacteria bacterium CG10_big_fil_rev_8_21_14_0_10_36_7]
MRKKRKYNKNWEPDFKYGNVLIGKLINYIMYSGKKSIAQAVVYGALDILTKQKKDALEVFETAVKNASPQMEVKSKRIGGANYQVPREVRGERKIMLSLRWIINAARSRKGKAMAEKLAAELLEASQNEGNAIKKKMDTHRMAEANKAFAHFAW